MTEEVNHLHQMESGLWELWLPSTAIQDTPDLEQAQESV